MNQYTVIVLNDNSDNGDFGLRYVTAATALDAALLVCPDRRDGEYPYIIFNGHLTNQLTDGDCLAWYAKAVSYWG